jgi:hypothetical protein
VADQLGRAGNQGFALSKQVLYHFKPTSSPFFPLLILVAFSPASVDHSPIYAGRTAILPISAFHVARIIDMNHCEPGFVAQFLFFIYLFFWFSL